MDLTGYGYRRSVLRQEIPEVTTSAVQKSEAPSAELSGEALRLLIKVNTKVALQELSVQMNWNGRSRLKCLTRPGPATRSL